MTILHGGYFNVQTDIWHGFVTSADKTVYGGHLGETSHKAHPNAAYNHWAVGNLSWAVAK